MRIDSSGRLLVGSASALDTTAGAITSNNSSSGGRLALGGNPSSAGSSVGEIFGWWNGNKVAGLVITSGADTTNKDDGELLFYTSSSGPSVQERMRINRSGNMGLGTDSPTDHNSFTRILDINGSGGGAVYCRTNGSSANVAIFGQSGSDVYVINKANGNIRFNVQDSERMRVDNGGRLLVGTTASTSLGTDSYKAQIKTTGASAGLGIIRTADSVAPPFFSLAKSRNDGIVQSGDGLGKIQWIAHDGNDYNNVSALINAEVDGTPGGDDVPGRLMFHTTADGAASPTERLRIDSSGRIGINNTSPSSTVNIGGDVITTVKPTVCIFPSSGSASLVLRGGEPTLCFDQTGGNNQRIIYDDSTDLVFQNGTLDSITERARFFDTGQTHHFSSSNCFVSATSQGAGTTYWLYRGIRSRTTNTSGGSTVFYVYSNGNVQNTNNSYGSISDVKLKENIVDATSQWEDLKALQIRKYNFIEGETHTQLGVVAQEVETVSPGLVNDIVDRDEEGNDLGTVTKTVNYSVLYMKAVKALQEAQTRIESLEARLDAGGL